MATRKARAATACIQSHQKQPHRIICSIAQRRVTEVASAQLTKGIHLGSLLSFGTTDSDTKTWAPGVLWPGRPIIARQLVTRRPAEASSEGRNRREKGLKGKEKRVTFTGRNKGGRKYPGERRRRGKESSHSWTWISLYSFPFSKGLVRVLSYVWIDRHDLYLLLYLLQLFIPRPPAKHCPEPSLLFGLLTLRLGTFFHHPKSDLSACPRPPLSDCSCCMEAKPKPGKQCTVPAEEAAGVAVMAGSLASRRLLSGLVRPAPRGRIVMMRIT